MGLLHSARVIVAMTRVTVSTVVDATIGRLDRHTMDGRAHQFAQRTIEILQIDLAGDRRRRGLT